MILPPALHIIRFGLVSSLSLTEDVGDAVEATPTLMRHIGAMRFLLREMRHYLISGLVRR